MSGQHPQAQVAAYYTAAAEHYALLWVDVIRPMGLRLLDALPLGEARRVLDVGTGVGALIPALRERAPGAVVVGTDLTEGMLRVARRTLSDPMAAMDAQRLALAGSSFDVTVMPFMLFHVPEPLGAVAEAARVLRPGGIVGTATWGDDPAYPAMQAFVQELEARGAPEPRGLPEAHDLMDTPRKVAGLMKRAGLRPIRTWTERSDFRWDPEKFLAYLGYGLRKQRLETLAPAERASCMARVRERLAAMGPDDYAYPFEIVYAIAERPGR